MAMPASGMLVTRHARFAQTLLVLDDPLLGHWRPVFYIAPGPGQVMVMGLAASEIATLRYDPAQPARQDGPVLDDEECRP